MLYGNGSKAIVSLTFDDGLLCQVNHAIPFLNRFKVPATFFLIAKDVTPYDGIFRRSTWQEAISAGHEIGSHTVNHRKAATMGPQDMLFETEVSRGWLESRLGSPVKSFCYPFTDAPGPYQEAVKVAGYDQARGGRVARPDKYYVPGDGCNLFNVTCHHVGPYSAPLLDEWVAEALAKGAWVTLMFHGVGDPQAWDNITKEQFSEMLTKLVAAKENGLSVETFGKGAGYYRQGRQ